MISSIEGTKLNTELYFYDYDNVIIVHLPLRGYSFRAGETSRILLTKLRDGIELSSEEVNTRLVQQLIEIGAIGDQIKPYPKTKPIEAFKPQEATLIFTESCNLKCPYCYANSINNKSETTMSIKIAKAAIDFVIENAFKNKNKTINVRYIGGGEPTLEWDLIQDITNYTNIKSTEKGIVPFIRLITNGTMLNEDRISWISKNIHFITLSFDILPRFQNSKRPYMNGEGTHKILSDAIRLISDYQVPFHLRSTISSDNVMNLVEMVQYVHDNYPFVNSIRFEPLAEIGRVNITNSINHSSSKLLKPTEDIFIEQFKSAYYLGKKYGIRVYCKMSLNHYRRSTRFCNVEFTVTPEGKISGCHRYSKSVHDGFDFYNIGEFDGNKFIFDLDKINQIRNVDVDSFEECRTCFAKWSCSSGCLSARINSNGINKCGPLCHLTRELLKFSIYEALKKEVNMI